MEQYNYITKTFKDIFPDYSTFLSWWNATQYGDFGDACNNKTFKLIFNEYACSHCSMQEEDFKNHFANDLYTYSKEFEKTTEVIDKMLTLSESDIAFDTTSIMNIANIPENESSTNIEEVNFVSQQQKNITKKGKVQITREELSLKRAYTTKTFLKRFKHLFIRILSKSYVPVIEETEGD